MTKQVKSRRKTGVHHPRLRRSNRAVARAAVIRALNHPKHRNLGDRALGRRLGLDHKTIGRWRKRLEGGEVPQTVPTKRQFLSACTRLSAVHPDEIWRELDMRDMVSVRDA